MRVLLVNDVCWSGGVESQMAALASGLSARGHAVSVFVYANGPGSHLFDGVCECVTGPRPTLGEHICGFDPDVISTNLSTMPLGFLRTIRRVGYAGGLAATCHGTVFDGWQRGGEGCATVAVSEHVAGLVRRGLQIEPTVIYNGVDSDVFTSNGPAEPSDPPVLLWVGRSDDPNKDFSGFAAVGSRFVEKGWPVWIVDGAVNPRMNTMCEWLGDKCTLFRDVSPVRMAEIYRGVGASGGCMLSTSRSEAFGLAVVEAMACGCPVVVPAVGGLREVVIDGQCGLVYDRSDGVGQVCERIVRVSQSELRDDLVRQAQARVMERFTREAMVSRYEELFESIAQPRRFVWWGRKTASRAMLAALRVGRTFSK